MESSVTSGTLAGNGSFRCASCDYAVSLSSADALPSCPVCGGTEFIRASLFTASRPTEDRPANVERDDDWLDEIRSGLEEPGQYLAYADGDETRVFSLTREWTRVGRSLAADVRFDDPTVSRRHALIVRQPDGVRVLDDRSLNGVFVNGERVEWSPLTDGDQVLVGRHQLRFLDIPAVTGMRETPALHEQT
ncbi:MAG: hypothetical protein QOK31_2158 [Solirubrobacteraceae bacterium]|jgi:predicted RNA-binding Zn-ribbon protein involved in translation (DUF1610 family)|nr:hypothetical protein [Solirubrobacteraceae bacterium]